MARLFTVFAVRPTREATALDVFLAETFQGIVTCDRAKMYWQVGRLQWCWAHLRRDFQAMIDSGRPAGQVAGRTSAAATCELFEHWADYRAEEISRAALVRRMGPVRRKVERLLLSGSQCGPADPNPLMLSFRGMVSHRLALQGEWQKRFDRLAEAIRYYSAALAAAERRQMPGDASRNLF